MKLVTYLSESGPRLAGVRGGAYVDVNRADASLPPSMKAILNLGAECLERVAAAVTRGEAFDAKSVSLMAPVPDPQKVICVGLNYADHAREGGREPPEEPVIFSKFATAVIGHEQAIELPEVSKAVDYEAELVVVIGRAGRNIPRSEAMDYVAGYCPGHDVSARDWQIGRPGGQWLLGKTFDTFAPFGPHLTTPDEAGDPGHLRIALRLNGETMQDSNTEQLIFPIDQLISHLSTFCTLLPGDVLFTGTPPGVGHARKPPVYLQPGDVCEVEIETLGVLRNPVVGASG